jgi:hypothetical protein
MTSPEFDKIVDSFFDWINPFGDDPFASFEERGIREDAPDEAKKAYAQFLEIEKGMRERGVKA